MRKIAVGMVGVANFGAARRALLRRAEGFELRVLYDRSPEALAAACREEGARAAGSFEEVIGDPGVEAVVISTGASSHADLAEAALRAGKHVFVEKPLCCNVAEAARLRRVQRETGLVVGMGHHRNDASPVVRLVRSLVADGSLGKVAAYEENTSHSGGFQIRPGDWRGAAGLNPGGMLFQCGVHALHTLQGLFGPVTHVSAMFRDDVNPDTCTTDVAALTLRHAGGLVGTLNCYHVTAYCHELRVFGTKGNVYIDTLEQRAWYQRALYGPREPRVEVPVPTTPDAEVANVRAWHAAVCGQGVADPDLEQGIAAVLPVFVAERAAREQRAVALAELAWGEPDEQAKPAPGATPGVVVTRAAAAAARSGA